MMKLKKNQSEKTIKNKPESTWVNMLNSWS
jgi:hypothetical protein